MTITSIVKFIAGSMAFSFLFIGLLYSQEPVNYAEAPVVLENGVLMSPQITINFKEKIFDLPAGHVDPKIDEISGSLGQLKDVLTDIEQRFGKFRFRKQIPSAVWGDVWRMNVVTGEQVRIHEWSQLFFMIFDQFVPIDTIMTMLNTLPEVDYTHEPVHAIADADPNDPEHEDQPDQQWNLFEIDANEAWDLTQGNTTVRIGIVEQDGLPNWNHPDLQGKFDDGNSGSGYHASMVAGMIGAATNNSIGIASMGWNLLMNSYSWNVEEGGSNSLVDAMTSAINSSDVINCSFTLYQSQTTARSCDDCLLLRPAAPGDYLSVDNVFADAINLDKIVVTSMSNGGHGRIVNSMDPDCGDLSADCLVPFTAYPANYAGIIGVTATDINNDVPDFYNRGGFIDIAAPGINILSTNHAAGYNQDSGSSFSAPMVAAIAGLIKSVNASLDPTEVEDILENTADQINETAIYAGAGRINAYEALKYTLENHGGTLAGQVLFDGNWTFQKDITIKSGATLTIEEGTTLNMEGGVNFIIENGASILAQGTSNQPIVFTSADGNPDRSDWGTIQVYSSNNSFEHCTVEGSTWGIHIYGTPNATTNNTIKNCTFRNNEQALRIENSTVTVEDALIENNYHALVPVNNSIVTFRDGLVKNNQRNGAYISDSWINILGSTFENNGLENLGSIHGIYARSGSDVSLGQRWSSSNPSNVAGFNSIRSNHGSGIYVKVDGLVHAGFYNDFWEVYSQGSNEIYGNGTFSGEDFTNLDANTMQATYNYWGGPCPPLASQTAGSVNTSLCLTQSPIILPQARRFPPALRKGINNGDSINPDDLQYKKMLIAIYKQTVATQPQTAAAVEALAYYYSLVRSDSANALREKQIVDTYLRDIYSNHPTLELGLKALRLRILEARHKTDLPAAISLSEQAAKVTSGAAREGVMFNLLFAYLLARDLDSAKDVLQRYKNAFPNKNDDIIFLEETLANAPSVIARNRGAGGQAAISSPASQDQDEFAIANELPVLRSYPNPFNPTTSINFRVAEETHVNVQIYNLLGQKVRTVFDGLQSRGEQALIWNGRNDLGQNVASGIYVVKVNTGTWQRSVKVSLIR